jgi:hypothetical protein
MAIGLQKTPAEQDIRRPNAKLRLKLGIRLTSFKSSIQVLDAFAILTLVK